MPEEDQAPVRNTERVSVPEQVKIAVWAKSAGRCAMCSTYLVGGEGFLHTTLVGELAHNVGATSGSRSPRGQSELSPEDRATESNLLLLCHPCHRKVDAPGMAEYYSESVLTAIKARHESRVRAATDFATLRPAFVLRVGSNVRGTYSLASNRQVAEAFLGAGLTAGTDDARDAIVNIDLPDPETWSTTWDRSKQVIDESVAKLRRDMGVADVELVGLFALAPIPTLAYLGFVLDDKGSVAVFPPSRRDGDDRWAWAEPTSPVPTFSAPVARDPEAKAIVVTVSISADVRGSALPSALEGMPRVELRPDNMQPTPLLLESRAAAESFSRAWRQTMANIEGAFPSVERIHVIAAVPVVAALELGRAHMRDAQPQLVIYQRSGETYDDALAIG